MCGVSALVTEPGSSLHVDDRSVLAHALGLIDGGPPASPYLIKDWLELADPVRGV